MSRFSLIFDAVPAADLLSGLAPASFDAGSLETLPTALHRSRYNIGRDQDIIVLCTAGADSDGALVARTMRWGFTPHWIHSPNPALQPLTVAADKASQPYFRDAFHQHRCLIPATGFYAWQGWENGPAAPCHVRMRNRQMFFMAAIWDNCEGVDRVAMITTDANSLIRPIHDRMPAIITREFIDSWLHGDQPRQLLVQHAPAAMEIYQVSRKIFSQANDSAELIEPMATAASTPVFRAQA